jgi:hypothetical protein
MLPFQIFRNQRNEAAQAEANRDVHAAVQRRLAAAQSHYDGIDEDSYASRMEARGSLSFLAHFSRQLARAEPGKAIDLSQTVTDYGYDPEAAASCRDCGLDYVPEAESLRNDHEARLGSAADLIGKLRQAGLEVDTSFHTIAPEDEYVVEVSGREWWEDQRANILASDMPADEAQRELATLGPEPPAGSVYLDGDGKRIEHHALEIDPIEADRTETEELRHEVGPLTLTNEREDDERQVGLEL